MTRMLVVRHGQSEWNAEGRWQGRADPALSSVGRHQARTAVERLGTVDAVVSSPLQRAMTTAVIIAEGLGVGPVVVEPGVIERDAGEWSGLTRDEIEARWPGWLGDHQRRPEGFEADTEVVARGLAALDRIDQAFRGGEVLVVAHGGVIRALERHLGVDHPPIPNLAGRWMHHEGTHVVLGERIVLVGEDEITIPTSI